MQLYLEAIDSYAHSLELFFYFIFVVAAFHNSSRKLWF